MSIGSGPDMRFPDGMDLRPTASLHQRAAAPIPADVSNAPHRVNSVLGGLLIAVMALAPIPLGSNRPAFWTIWAAIIGLLALGYGIALIAVRGSARLPLGRFWPEATCFFLLILWLVAQILPIGRWLPASLTIAPAIGTPTMSLSLDPGSTTMTLLNFATYGLLFFLFAQVAANRRRARSLLLALFTVVAVFAIYGLISLVQLGDTILGFEKLYYKGNATGTFVNRNSFGTFLAAGLAMGVPLLLDNQGRARSLGQLRTWIQPALVLSGMAFIGAALLATNSRMGATAGLAGTLVGLLLSLIGGEKGRARWWFAGILVAAGAIVAAFFGTRTIERFIFDQEVIGRPELHLQVWEAIWQRPLTGFGGGSFASVFPAFQHAPLGSTDAVWDRAHSTYLALWFELGLVAGTLPLVIIAGLVVRALGRLTDPSSRGVSIAAISVAVVFGLHSLVDFSAEIMADAFLLTAVLALGAAGANHTVMGKS